MIDKKTDNIAAKSDFFIKKHGTQGTGHRAQGTDRKTARPQDRKTARPRDTSLKINKRTRR